MSYKDVNPVNPSKPKRVTTFWAGMVNQYLELCVVGTPVSGAMKIAEVEP